MAWHQVTFDTPRCAAAKRLMDLRERRSELLHQSRVADLEENSAERELERRRSELQTAEARAFAFGQQVDNLSTLRGALTRAEKAHGEAVASAEQLRQAVIVMDAEMVRVAADNLDELLAEIAEDHDAMRQRADDAVSQLDAAAGAMRAMYASAMALVGNVDTRLNTNIRTPVTAAEMLSMGAAPPLFNERPRRLPQRRKAAA